MSPEDLIRDLEHTLEGWLDGLSPLEKALRVAKVFREVCGDEWTIEVKADGGFTVTRKAMR